MPKTNQPYDPQPERGDALGELARKGYQAVPGDHAARLKSLQDRLGLPAQEEPVPEAIVRTMRPRRWLAVAAGIAALLVAGIALLTYDSSEQKVARDMTQAEAPYEPEADNSAADVSEVVEEAEYIAVSTADKNKDTKPEPSSNSTTDQKESLETQSDLLVGQSSEASNSGSPIASPPVVAEDQALDDAIAAAPEKMEEEVDKVTNTDQRAATSAPPSAKSINGSERAKKRDINILADGAEAVAENTSGDGSSSYRMERATAVKTREVSGEVIEPSGVPVIGAILTIEETGQQAVTDQKGEFLILVDDKAVVGQIAAEGYSTFLFDVTAGEEYRIYLPRVSSSLPSAQLKGKEVGLRIVAPKAEPYPAFDEYVATKRSEFSGQKAVVQFDVNRFGRPRQIVAGPGKQNRDAVKQIKEWLKNGPDWPEAYQKNSWRYEVNLK